MRKPGHPKLLSAVSTIRIRPYLHLAVLILLVHYFAAWFKGSFWVVVRFAGLVLLMLPDLWSGLLSIVRDADSPR